MARVYLICGKICSGKTWYAEQLKMRENAVILSCDEIMFALFDGELGERHDDMAERIKRYFYLKSIDIVRAGTNVILEWGFWTKEWRRHARDFYQIHGIETQMHYIDVDYDRWILQIDKRNQAVREGLKNTYMIDEGLMRKLDGLFEAPSRDEIDVTYVNQYDGEFVG